jgi:hypothetical protein
MSDPLKLDTMDYLLINQALKMAVESAVLDDVREAYMELKSRIKQRLVIDGVADV